MAKPVGKSRSAGIKVNLVPEVYEKLKVLADRQGQTAGGLASVAVGMFVSSHWGPIELQERLGREAADMLKAMPAQLELMISEGKP